MGKAICILDLSYVKNRAPEDLHLAIAYPQEMWQPLVTSPDPAILIDGPTRLSPSAAGAICEFFSFHFPDHIFAFLKGCASRFAAKNIPLNFVPPLHEFFD